MSQSEIEIDRFEAQDENENIYTLVVYQSYSVSQAHSGKTSRSFLGKRIATDSGLAVNFIDENTFELAALSLTLKRL